MYTKILKETASQLTVLAVKEDMENRVIMGDNLECFFRQITYVANAEEALYLYRSEKFDLVLIDIDTFSGDINRFISDIHRQDIFQAIIVCSERKDDPVLLMRLLNERISGFIPKPYTQSGIYEVLFKVCEQVQERQLLLHYLNILENQHEAALEVSCRSECPMKAELQPIKVIQPIQAPQVEDEDDDMFEFFPTQPVQTAATIEHDSMYQDYFNLLDSDDREDLHDLLIDIDTTIINAFTDMGANAEYIEKLGASLMRYGNVLMHYQFFCDMGTAILEFGKVISNESEKVAMQSEIFHSLISGFCSGLQTFMVEVWGQESDKPKFFNDSIINDAELIKDMIVPPVVEDHEDDLVFF